MFSVESSMIDGDVVEVHFYSKKKDKTQFVEIKRLQVDDMILAKNKVLDENGGNVIRNFKLKQNFPNPFNLSTLINYSLKEGGLVKLIVYNVSGQQIKVLVNGNQEKGNYTVSWDGIDDSGKKVAGGIYFYQLITANFKETKKMVIVE
jgi:methionine-rich copper-binding protein CopC